MRVSGGDDPVAEEADRLYGLAPDRFVAEREAAVKRLRAAGQRPAAAAVHRLARPSLAAWAVNQLARRHPDQLDELLAAGEELRRAQRRALSGREPTGLREANARRRAVIERLADAGAHLLVEAGSAGEAHRDRLVATLEAASVDPEVGAEVRRGRLAREVEARSGLGVLDEAADESEAAEAEAAEVDAEAEAARAAAERAAREAAARAERAETRAADAAAEVARLEAELESARARADRARAEADAARAEVDR
jgi:hypothetical protein